jgi:hypothetical protein
MSSSSIEIVIKNEPSLGETAMDNLFSRSENYLTREAYIRNEILKITKSESRISGFYKELLRSMVNLFSDLVCIDDENKIQKVKCIYANPERAVAKIKQDNSVILPLISVSQTKSSIDSSRSRYKTLLINEVSYDPIKNKAVRILSIAPVPVDITYNINIWCKYKSDLDQITEQIRLKFNPDADLVIPGHNSIKAYLGEDNSDEAGLEAADKDDRELKSSLSVKISTYLSNPKFVLTSNGTIERLNLEF